MTIVPFAKPVRLASRYAPILCPPTMPSIDQLTEIYARAVHDHWLSPWSGDPGVDTSNDDVKAGVLAVADAIRIAQVSIVHYSKAIFDDVDATLDTTLILPELDDYDVVAEWLDYLAYEHEVE